MLFFSTFTDDTRTGLIPILVFLNSTELLKAHTHSLSFLNVDDIHYPVIILFSILAADVNIADCTGHTMVVVAQHTLVVGYNHLAYHSVVLEVREEH